jgi:hypothetical protein
VNRGKEKEGGMKSRTNGYYAPQVTEASYGNSSFAELAFVDVFLYRYGFDGKKVVPSTHSHGYTKTQYQTFRGTIDSFGKQFPYLGSFYHLRGPLGSISAPFTAVVDENTNRNAALSKLYDKLFTAVDLSVDTWQWKQTAQLAKDLWDLARFLKNKNPNALKKSYDVYQSARRRLAPKTFGPKRRKEAVNWRKHLRNTGSAWLQFSYGVRPLMQDVFDTLDAMRAPKRQIIKIKVSKATREIVSSPIFGWQMGGFGGWTLRGENRKTVRHSFAIDFVIAESAMDSLKRFTTLDPKRFLWENIPFSFVADWVWNLGGYMELMEKAQNSQRGFAGGTESVVVHRTSNYKAVMSNINELYELVGAAESWTLDVAKDRTVLSGSPTPNAPTFKLDFSSPWRALNAISLLVQGFK